MSRIYLPATLDLLSQWYADRVVPGLADGYEASEETEEDEYAALMAAAEESGALLAGPGRRVVVVVEAASTAESAPFAKVVAVHADLADRPVGADPAEDLGWFATQEVPDLIGRPGGRLRDQRSAR
ncbi:MAG: hypothetical protein QM638_09230 [Nocardioides sp.]|uniref:DUF6912 family protein n=1 Tax=Nocardioides sp. TaxID=35761 RepID=UPI0039E694BD